MVNVFPSLLMELSMYVLDPMLAIYVCLLGTSYYYNVDKIMYVDIETGGE